MKTHALVTSIAALALATAIAPPAEAALVTGGFSGSIFSGFDFGGGAAGYFGAGGDLSGLPITGTFSYDTARVPPASSSGSNWAVYSDPAFATDFLDFSVTINGQTYAFGNLPAGPGIQTLEVIDNTDQLQFDYQRFAINGAEAITLRLISAIDFLTGTGVPTSFDFTPGGVGLFPGGSFSFDLPSGAFASASFDIASAHARVQAVPEPATLALVFGALPMLWAAGRRRKAG